MSVTAGALATPKGGWWRALNPAIYLVSVLPGVAVWQLAGAASGNRYAVLAATLAVVFLQHSINVLNDVSDWRLGADAEKWDSWVRAHRENLMLASLHGWLSFLAGGLLGLVVLYLSSRLWILAIALPMVGLGYLYNSGKKPLSYTRMGEWVTGLCYGPGVVGCLWLLSGTPIDLRYPCGMSFPRGEPQRANHRALRPLPFPPTARSFDDTRPVCRGRARTAPPSFTKPLHLGKLARSSRLTCP